MLPPDVVRMYSKSHLSLLWLAFNDFGLPFCISVFFTAYERLWAGAEVTEVNTHGKVFDLPVCLFQNSDRDEFLKFLSVDFITQTCTEFEMGA